MTGVQTCALPIWNLLKGLQVYSGLELQVLILNPGRPADEIRDLGIGTVIIDETVTPFCSLLRFVRAETRKFRPDVIHSHRYKENVLAYCASRAGGHAALVRTQHGMPERYSKSFLLKDAVIRYIDMAFLSRCFDTTVVVSGEMKAGLLSEIPHSSKRLEVIHNGVMLPEPFPKAEKETFVIGTCGRLNIVKNYALFVKVAARIHLLEPKIRFELAGDGPEMDFLRKRVEDLGLEAVFRFRGHMDEISYFFRGLDLFVSTSLHEGIPMSVLEGMSYGLPVIAPSVGGFKEIVTHGADGFLIDGHDSRVFAEKCLALYRDTDLRQKMGNSAREKVKNHFSLQRMSEQYYQLYKTIKSS